MRPVEVGDLLRFVCRDKPDIYCVVLNTYERNDALVQWIRGYDGKSFKQITTLNRTIYGTFQLVQS
jgi:hypothetical protein